MKKKTWEELMKYLDPFETHAIERRRSVWESELSELEKIIENAPTNPHALDSDYARRCGGRLVDVRKRIKHVKTKLGSKRMRLFLNRLSA
ncbi:hypothetical protein HQ487_01995 [Candidatus Uhrbacteria bacterium]|nr:hypothetical protein [Candidatus Uhrbacteria bacterium]